MKYNRIYTVVVYLKICCMNRAPMFVVIANYIYKLSKLGQTIKFIVSVSCVLINNIFQKAVSGVYSVIRLN